jgi:equilibrative nucleoside transporter 1/2/3
MALGFLIPYQRHLSLRVLVLQPLLITLIMLASTAALVMLPHW